tara:strand:+ start:4991 stop:5152 length:162 start_codon:yes stop_codon:yes gene_type:complete
MEFIEEYKGYRILRDLLLRYLKIESTLPVSGFSSSIEVSKLTKDIINALNGIK